MKKKMSATPVEFFRSLTHFVPDHKFNENQSSFTLPVGGGTAEVAIKVLPRRRVTGLLSLPQLEVLIEFNQVEDGLAHQFLKDFDLAFRRGGG